MKFKVLLLSIMMWSASFGQYKDCESLLSDTCFFLLKRYDDTSRFKLFAHVLHCGGITGDDSIIYYNPTYTGSLLVSWADQVETNQDLVDLMQAEMKKEHFLNMKAMLVPIIRMDNTVITRELVSTRDEDLMDYLKVVNASLEDFDRIVDENEGWGMTFRELTRKIEAQEDVVVEEYNASMNESFKTKINWTDIVQNSLELNKPTILFFTGFGAINAHKMEDYILIREDVNDLMNDFNFYALYVDDREAMNEKRQDQEIAFSTWGKYWVYIQQEKFDADRQPYFVILDMNMKPVAVQEYTLDVDTFKEFLKKGFELAQP